MRQLFLAIALLLGSSHAQGAALVEIPPQNGIAFEVVWKISGDGSVLVGSCITPEGSFAPCRWSASRGYVLLGVPPGVDYYHDVPLAVTHDGGFVYGAPGGSRPARWNANGQIELLPGFPQDELAYVHDVSADGSVVVGQLGSRPFRWKAPGQIELHPEGRVATAVSSDGSVAAVCCSRTGLQGQQEGRAFVWRADGSMRLLPRLHRYSYEVPGGISGDGRYVLLARDPSIDLYGFAWRWSEKRGQELIARPTREAMLPIPFDASTDGSTVVGTTERYWGESFVWDEPHGARRLLDVLVERGVDVGARDGFTQTVSISDDGLRIPARATQGGEPVGYVIAVLAPACSDGVDNDGDGSADGADADCASTADDSESLETGGAAAPLGLLLAFVPLAFVRRRILVIAAAIVLLPAAAGAAGVTPIEPRDGVTFAVYAMSGDGRVLAGTCRQGSTPRRPCRWRLDSGAEWLGGQWESGDGMQIVEVSGDGSIVVGSRPLGINAQAVRWLANGAREDLIAPAFHHFLRATHVAPDGSVIAGQNYYGGALRWTQEAGVHVVPLGSDTLGHDLFTGQDALGPFVFTFGGAPIRLPDLDEETPFSASAATPDGTTIVASGEWFSPRIPVWRADGGLERLAPSDYPFFLQPWVRAISDDASTIVGADQVAGAFVWQAESGLMRLADYLAVRHRLATPEWDFEDVLDLSADGRTVLVRGYRNGAQADAVVSLAPACDDGLDNDSDGAVDMADPQCLTPEQRAERRACGLGFEIAFMIAPLAFARAGRRATRTRP